MACLLIFVTVGWEIASMKNCSDDFNKSFTAVFISGSPVSQNFQRDCRI